MNPTRIALVSAAAILSLSVAVMAGCSKKSNPVAPSGGGGGGGNTPFNSGVLSTGAIFQRVFPTAGSVGYHCTPHQSSGMTGTITISASDTTSFVHVIVGPSGQLVFSPSSVTIKPGGTVHWHTVTSN